MTSVDFFGNQITVYLQMHYQGVLVFLIVNILHVPFVVVDDEKREDLLFVDLQADFTRRLENYLLT